MSHAQHAPDRAAIAIRGGAVRVVGYVGGVLVSLGAAAVLLRHLGVTGFGRYVTVTSLIGLAGGVTEAGITAFGVREFAARNETDRRRLLANLLGIRLTLTLVGIGCAACFGLAVGYDQVLVFGTLLVGAGLLVQVVADVLSISLQVQLRLGSLAVVDLSRRLVAFALIGALALMGASLLSFLAVSIVAGVVALSLLAWMVSPSVTIRLSFDWRVWRNLLAETLPFAIAVSVGAIYLYVTVIIMSLIASGIQTGYFATSFRVTQVALAIPSLLLTAIWPLMSRGRSDRETAQAALGNMVGKVFTVAVICGLWMSLAMALGASFIIDVIAGIQGRGAISVLRIQGLVFVMSFISTSSGLGLLSLRRYRPLMIASLSALILNVVLGLALIPALGARGGALADVLTETMVAVGLTVAIMRVVGPRRITASAVPSVLLAAALSATVMLVPVGPVVHVICASVIYFGVLLLMGTIPEEVTSAARRLRVMRAAS